MFFSFLFASIMTFVVDNATFLSQSAWHNTDWRELCFSASMQIINGVGAPNNTRQTNWWACCTDGLRVCQKILWLWTSDLLWPSMQLLTVFQPDRLVEEMEADWAWHCQIVVHHWQQKWKMLLAASGFAGLNQQWTESERNVREDANFPQSPDPFCEGLDNLKLPAWGVESTPKGVESPPHGVDLLVESLCEQVGSPP